MTSLTIPQTMEGSEGTSTWSRFLALGLALVHLGRQEGASVAKEALNVVAEPLRTFAITLLDVCAYAGQSLFFPKLLLNVNYECLTTPLELFRDLCNFVFISGTGSVLKIQEQLHICSESYKPEDMEEAGKEGETEGTGKTAATDSKAGEKGKSVKDKTEGPVSIF